MKLKLKSKYNTGKIYIIKFKNNDNHIYIGSTIKNINHRFNNHIKSHLYKRNKTSLTKYITKNYKNDWSNCYISLLLNYPCKNKKELEKKEFELINKYKKYKKYSIININGILYKK